MQDVIAAEAANNLGDLLDRVQNGEELLITRRGKLVARLMPGAERVDTSQSIAAADRIRARASQSGSFFNWEELKAEREMGRP